MYDLEGKMALITGGSRGIGRDIALGLAQCGADIVVNYIGNDEKAEEVKALVEDMGRRCILAKADLSQEDCGDRIHHIVKEVDILVLNGSVQYRNHWKDIGMEDFAQQINCNFRSGILLIQKYVPYMIRKQWGRIVTIGSVQEKKPHPDMLIYASTKAALRLMAKSLAVQLASDGITVNSIAPGVIRTDRNAKVLEDQQYYQSVLNTIPMGVCGDTRDCVGLVKLLCAEEGRYITGQNIFVDGGMGNC